MTHELEFFFDLSSPWTRIAFHNFRANVEKRDVTVRWRPFLVGGVFNAVNDSVYEGRRNADNPKFRLTYVWMKEWAKLSGLLMNFPSQHHPVKSVNAMRFCCALEDDQDALLRFSEAAFHAYFTDQRNIDDIEELSAIADAAGLSGRKLVVAARSPEIKELLRANTQEAIDRGAFGSPTIFVDKKFMYFGNDQLPLVYRRLEGAIASAE